MKFYPNRLLLFIGSFSLLSILFGQAQTDVDYKNLDSISRFYYENDLEQSRKYRLQALEVAQSLDDQAFIFESLSELGEIFSELGDYNQALNYFEKSLPFSSSMDDSVNVYADMSQPYRALGDNDQAALILIKSLKLVGKKPSDLKIKVLNKLGLFYRGIKEPSKAAAYFRQIPPNMQAVGDEMLQIPYINISLIYLDENQWDSAIYYLEKSYPYLVDQNDQYGLSLYHNNLGTIYFEKEKYSLALSEAKKAIEMKKRMGLKARLANSLNLLSGISLGLEDFKNAESYALEALAMQDSSSVDNVRYNSLRYLIESRLGSRDLLEINDLVDQLRALNSKRFEQDKTESIAEAEAKYEVAIKEEQLKTQEIYIQQQSIQRNALIAGLFLLLVVIFLVYRSQRIKAKANRQLEEKNKQIREAELLKSRWFVNVSHELKTPITLVQGPIQKILDHDRLNEVDKSDLKMANRNLKQLRNLTSEILDLSKLENSALELKEGVVEFSSLIRSEVAAFESLAVTNKVKLSVSTVDEVMIKADESKLRKLVQNLVSNALKFTHEGGYIEVIFQKEGDYFELQVKDNGEGISEEDLPFVFDRFYQSKDENKSNQGGTGIGLALSKEIAKMHSGSLDAFSRRNEGSTFSFKIPTSLEYVSQKADTTDLEYGKPDQVTFQSRSNSNPSILLAEDNADMREYILGIMKHDYKVTLARDGKDALEKIRNNHFDLIISDIMMPRMDGLELIKEVKKNDKWSQIPFIILTALDNEEHRIHTLRTGIDDYLSKPFNPEELKVRVANLLKNLSGRRDIDAEENLSFDDQLIKTLEEEVNNHLTDHLLSVSFLAEKVAMSERNLRRYLKKVTGLSPSDFILEIKLQKAFLLLEKNTLTTVKEVAHQSGFDRSDRFSSAFLKRYGKSPSEYL